MNWQLLVMAIIIVVAGVLVIRNIYKQLRPAKSFTCNGCNGDCVEASPGKINIRR